MNKTSIEWTDFTWNPVTGCHKVSPGCKNCYAETLTNRFAKPWGVSGFREIKLHPERLDEPAMMGEKLNGKRIFVCDMSDLFHEDVPFDFIDMVYGTMFGTRNTTWQILTKRPDRMLEYHKERSPGWIKDGAINTGKTGIEIWHGVSIENQKYADERIPLLLQVPSTVRFLSCEPLLGAIDLSGYFSAFVIQLHWVICGGESGLKARPMHPDWARSLRDQCNAAGVPFFFKQWGEWEPDSHVSFNGPFLIQCKKHFLINIDGYGHPYVDMFENAPEPERTLTKKDNAYWMAKVGKNESGNHLDGIHHMQFPKSHLTKTI
jgi:protein gp37